MSLLGPLGAPWGRLGPLKRRNNRFWKTFSNFWSFLLKKFVRTPTVPCLYHNLSLDTTKSTFSWPIANALHVVLGKDWRLWSTWINPLQSVPRTFHNISDLRCWRISVEPILQGVFRRHYLAIILWNKLQLLVLVPRNVSYSPERATSHPRRWWVAIEGDSALLGWKMPGTHWTLGFLWCKCMWIMLCTYVFDTLNY